EQDAHMTEIELACGRQVTPAQLVVACHQGIRSQGQFELRRAGKLPKRVWLVRPVESRWTWSVMVDAMLAALVILEQSLAQFGHLALKTTSRGNTQCAQPRDHRNGMDALWCANIQSELARARYLLSV